MRVVNFRFEVGSLVILLITTLVLSSCKPVSKPIPPVPPKWKIIMQYYFVAGEKAFEKAENYIDFKPTTAKEYFSKAIMYFRDFLNMTRGEQDPELDFYIKMAKRKIETAKRKITFINSRIRRSLDHYQRGKECYAEGIEFYNQWKYTKDSRIARRAIEELRKAINAFEKVEDFYTPEEYNKAQAKIKDSREKIQEITTHPPQSKNRAPIANASAGSSQVYVNTPVTLDGSESYDPDNDSLSYRWTQIRGPSVTLSNPTDVKPTFTPKEAGTYTFCLVVNDGKVNSTPAYVTITVREHGEPEEDLGTFTHNGYVGTNVEISSAEEGTMKQRQCKVYRLHIQRDGELEVCIPAGYILKERNVGSNPNFQYEGLKRFAKYNYQFMSYIREVNGNTDIIVRICRTNNSPSDFIFIFHLYPPGRQPSALSCLKVYILTTLTRFFPFREFFSMEDSKLKFKP